MFSSCIISDVCSISLLGFAVIGAFCGYGFGILISGNDSSTPIWTCIFALLFTICLFVILMQPMIVTSDTLLICFSENPEHLDSTAHELSEELKKAYRSKLAQKTGK